MRWHRQRFCFLEYIQQLDIQAMRLAYWQGKMLRERQEYLAAKKHFLKS